MHLPASARQPLSLTSGYTSVYFFALFAVGSSFLLFTPLERRLLTAKAARSAKNCIESPADVRPLVTSSRRLVFLFVLFESLW